MTTSVQTGEAASTRDRARRTWGGARSAVLVLLALVPVAVLFVPRRLVLMDGGLHLSSAEAVRWLVTGRGAGLLEWRVVLPPNLLIELVMAGPAGLLDPDTALRVVLAVTLVALAVALLVLVRAAGAPGWTVALTLPVLANATVLAGFLGYLAAFVPALLAVALVLRADGRPRPTGLTLLLVLTWFTHLVPALVASVVVVLVVLVAHRGAVKPALRLVAIPLGTVAALTAVFVAGGGSDGLGSTGPFGGLRTLDLAQPLVSLDAREYLAARLLALALYGAAGILLVVRRHAGTTTVVPADGLLVAAVAVGALAVVVPETVGSVSYIATRLSVWWPLLLGAWIAAQWPLVARRPACTDRSGRAGRVAIVAAALVAALVVAALPLLRLGSMTELGEDLAEIRDVGAVAPSGSTIVQLTLDSRGGAEADRLTPLIDQVGQVAALRGLLDLGNISGTTSYYPWRFTERARVDPLLAAEQVDIELAPPQIDLGRALAGGYPLDAVLVVGRRDADPDLLADPLWLRTQADLERAFRRVAVGADDEAELWVRAP